MVHVMFVFFLISINDFCLHAMEKNDRIDKLMSFIEPQTHENNYYYYLGWSSKPLARYFKENPAWNPDILCDLFSNNPKKQSIANQNCRFLLNQITNNQESIHQKKGKAFLLKCCNCFAPVLLIGLQIYFNEHETCNAANLAGNSILATWCTQNLIDLDEIDQALSRHNQQLDFIKEEILTKIEKSENKNNCKKFMPQLIAKKIKNVQEQINSIKKITEELKKND